MSNFVPVNFGPDPVIVSPCLACPWRIVNQGKRHPFGWYRHSNLRRLWNQIRRGGGMQSCHPTDPSHPDHVAMGTKPGAVTRECAGSIILVQREIQKVGDTKESIAAYFQARRGLTRAGLAYWGILRGTLGHVPLMGGKPLPKVRDDPNVGLPEGM